MHRATGGSLFLSTRWRVSTKIWGSVADFSGSGEFPLPRRLVDSQLSDPRRSAREELPFAPYPQRFATKIAGRGLSRRDRPKMFDRSASVTVVCRQRDCSTCRDVPSGPEAIATGRIFFKIVLNRQRTDFMAEITALTWNPTGGRSARIDRVVAKHKLC